MPEIVYFWLKVGSKAILFISGMGITKKYLSQYRNIKMQKSCLCKYSTPHEHNKRKHETFINTYFVDEKIKQISMQNQMAANMGYWVIILWTIFTGIEKLGQRLYTRCDLAAASCNDDVRIN